MENNTDHSEQNNYPLSVQEVDVDFLPIVYEIIRRYYWLDLFLAIHFVNKITRMNITSSFSSVERDYHETSAKARESQECSLKVLELQKKLEIARSQVNITIRISFFFFVLQYYYCTEEKAEFCELFCCESNINPIFCFPDKAITRN